MALIEVENVTKIFGPRPKEALARYRDGLSKEDLLAETGHTLGIADVSLSIAEGEIFVVMGLSGSGKSTLIRHFNRLIEPTAGKILVRGHNVLSMSQRELERFRRTTMSMVFQRFGLMPHRTVVENVAYGLSVSGMGRPQRREAAMRWVEAVGLRDELEPEEAALLDRPSGRLPRGTWPDAVWRVEGLGVLLWALGRRDLPPSDELVDVVTACQAAGIASRPGAGALLDRPRLRPPAELEAFARRAFACHWRLVEVRLRGEPLDLRAAGREAWFGPLDASGLPLDGDGELVLRGRPVTELAPDELLRCGRTAAERDQAARWLLGAHARYGAVDLGT